MLYKQQYSITLVQLEHTLVNIYKSPNYILVYNAHTRPFQLQLNTAILKSLTIEKCQAASKILKNSKEPWRKCLLINLSGFKLI